MLFQRSQLIHFIDDMLVAGPDATKATIGWGILCLLHYPATQDKIQEEIDRVIGKSRDQIASFK